MNYTDNFNLKMYEGSDKFNPLTVENDNTEAIDEALYDNQQAGICKAEETKTGSVHALVRDDSATPMFRFTATSDYTTGDTFTVDGIPYTTKTPSGASLSTGAYVIGSEVLCCVRDTLLTIFTGDASVSADSEKLGGQLPSYYAKASDVSDLGTDVENIDTVVDNLINKLSDLPTGTLAIGETTLVISNIGIRADGLIDIYTSKYGLYPNDAVTVNGSITLTFDAQTEPIVVKVRCL